MGRTCLLRSVISAWLMQTISLHLKEECYSPGGCNYATDQWRIQNGGLGMADAHVIASEVGTVKLGYIGQAYIGILPILA
jgi:hypothetical protein